LSCILIFVFMFRFYFFAIIPSQWRRHEKKKFHRSFVKYNL
jgi:preprotein translocase subunit YajC